MRLARVLPVFSAAFAVLYLAAMYNNLALVTYVPRLHLWLPLAPNLPKSAGPGMYWYGWLATSALGAVAIAMLALLVPAERLSPVARRVAWIAPVAVMLALIYILRGWFVH